MAVKLENGEMESRHRVLLPELSTFMTIHEIPCYVLIYNRIGIHNYRFQSDKNDGAQSESRPIEPIAPVVLKTS